MFTLWVRTVLTSCRYVYCWRAVDCSIVVWQMVVPVSLFEWRAVHISMAFTAYRRVRRRRRWSRKTRAFTFIRETRWLRGHFSWTRRTSRDASGTVSRPDPLLDEKSSTWSFVPGMCLDRSEYFQYKKINPRNVWISCSFVTLSNVSFIIGVGNAVQILWWNKTWPTILMTIILGLAHCELLGSFFGKFP